MLSRFQQIARPPGQPHFHAARATAPLDEHSALGVFVPSRDEGSLSGLGHLQGESGNLVDRDPLVIGFPS